MLALLLLACQPDTPVSPPTSPSSSVGALQFVGPPPTNLLVISLDTMRRDHAGRYRVGGESLTPFLDARMAEGVELVDFTSCSNWTVAATTCALAGATNLDRAGSRGMVPILTTKPLANLPGEGDPFGPTPLLPFWLGLEGFSTGLVTANGYFSALFGNAQGFDQIVYPGPERLPVLTELALSELPLSLGRRYTHLHAFEPHAPYLPDPAYLGGLDALPPLPYDLTTEEGQNAARAALAADPPVLTDDVIAAIRDHLRVRYAGEVAQFDAGLEESWAALDAVGWLDDTLVVFFTDHGEALWEHESVSKHAHRLYREENDAIAWFWAKNLTPGAWSGPTTQSDLAPTVMAVFGLPIPPEMTGIPVGLAPEDRLRFSFADAIDGPVHALHDGHGKMQFRWSGDGRTNLGYYDLASDPEERFNRYDPDDPSPEVRRAWALLKPEILAAEPWVAADPRGWEVAWPAGLP